MYQIKYQKRKNRALFEKMGRTIGLIQAQNYNPLYERIFSLNSGNYNTVCLDHPWYVSNIYPQQTTGNEIDSFIDCQLHNIDPAINPIKTDVFAKYVPLENIIRYACGKIGNAIDLTTDEINPRLKLPQFGNNIETKINNKNNTAYTDNFFVYLTSLLHQRGFIHGIEYYGSFLGYKKDLKYNITDEFDDLYDDKNFKKNNGVLFHLDDYDYLLNDQLVPIDDAIPTIGTLDSIADELIDDITTLDTPAATATATPALDSSVPTSAAVLEEVFFTQQCPPDSIPTSTISKDDDTLSDISSCSSHTNTIKTNNDDDANTQQPLSGNVSESSITSDYSLEDIFITIPLFPVQMICMEAFEDTLETAMFDETLRTDTTAHCTHFFAALMQIIMTLITYQHCFQFTHNDLHTNNVMYVTTDHPYLFYTYAGKHYRVPTYGRIYKVIDFGRAIYTFNGRRFSSDANAPGGDADTLYNTEPYYINTKPRIDPNYSFDLTRLATTMFDFIMTEDDKDICNIESLSACNNPVKRIITEWCLDDNGKNVLFKANGEERYPDFKLYKMIARFVHNHTPDAQLTRPEFAQFLVDDITIQKARAALATGKLNRGKKHRAHKALSAASPIIMDIDQLICEFMGKDNLDS